MFILSWFPFIILQKKVFFAKTNLSFQNFGIFHNLLLRFLGCSGWCGNPGSLTQMGLGFCDLDIKQSACSRSLVGLENWMGFNRKSWVESNKIQGAARKCRCQWRLPLQINNESLDRLLTEQQCLYYLCNWWRWQWCRCGNRSRM